MIKNMYKYFFLTASLFFFTPKTMANAEEEPVVTETMIIEDEDSDSVFYDHLDYLADHQPETVEQQSPMLQWLKNKFGPLYIALLFQLGRTQDYFAKKWQALKRSLPLY